MGISARVRPEQEPKSDLDAPFLEVEDSGGAVVLAYDGNDPTADITVYLNNALYLIRAEVVTNGVEVMFDGKKWKEGPGTFTNYVIGTADGRELFIAQ